MKEGGGGDALMHVLKMHALWEHIVSLNGCLRNLVGLKNSCPSTCFKAFGPDPPRDGFRMGQE